MRPTSSTILLMENDPLEVLRLLYAFARSGHTAPIESTGDGIDAVAQLGGTGDYANRSLFPAPRLVLIDLNLDRGSGFQVLEWIQASKELAGLPSVVLTSSQQPRDVQRAYALGACDFRVKPPGMVDLCALIRDLDRLWRTLRN